MKKEPFVTKTQLDEIVKEYPTPFHLYDEKGIRENVKALKEAFAWNKGYKEYFAVKATPNPYILNILKEYGCAFKKVGLRRSLCISTASSAFLVKADASKTHFEDVRIAFGAIGPVPRRMMEIEDRLKGEVISKGLIQKMEEYIPEDVVRSRSRKEYRRNVVKNFTLAGIYEALAEIGIIPQ